MENVKRTPIPWQQCGKGYPHGVRGDICSIDGEVIARINHSAFFGKVPHLDALSATVAKKEGAKEVEANAAYIVKSVNTHERLLELAAEALWKRDYPQGGSIYKTYDSLNFQDKEIYRKEALTAAEAK